jgi:hypothetical protein
MSDHLTTQDALGLLLDDFVHTNPAAAILFTDTSCRVADAVEPKVAGLLERDFPEVRFTVVSRTDAPQRFAELGVVAYPTVIVWFGGKESARFVRAFSIDAIAEAIERPYSILFGS